MSAYALKLLNKFNFNLLNLQLNLAPDRVENQQETILMPRSRDGDFD